MSGTEVFIYSLLGFAAGCFVNVGYILQLLYLVSIKNAGRLERFAFFVMLAIVGFACGIATVLILLLIVFRDGWSWWRMGVFVSWLAISMGASVFGFHRVAKGLNPLLKQLG